MCVNDTKYAREATINSYFFNKIMSCIRISLQNGMCVYAEFILTQQCLILCIPVLELGGAISSLVTAPLSSPELEQV